MRLLDKLNRYQVAKNASAMALAQVATRVGQIVYLAALARHVGADGIGAISTGTALNAMLLLLVGPGLSVLVIRDVAADRTKAGDYIANGIFLRLMLLVPFAILTTTLAYLSPYSAETRLIVHIYTVVFALDTLGEVMISGFRAYERMELEAGLQLVRDFSNIGLSLVAIALGWPLLAIVAVSLVAQVVKFALTGVLLAKYIVRPRFRPDVAFSRRLLLASLPFGVLMIIQTLQAEFGTYILSISRGADEVGVFAAANTLVLMLLFVPNSFAAAIFPRLSRLYGESRARLREFFRVAYKYLLVLGFPLAVGTILVGDRAIQLVYGEEFAAAAPVIRVMGIFLFTIVGYANGALLYAANEQRFYAWTQGLAALLSAILGLVLIPPLGPIGAALAFATSGFVTFLVHSARSHALLDLSLPWGTMARILVAAVVMGAALLAVIDLGLPWLAAAALVAPATYAAALVLLGVVSRAELRVLGGRSPDEPEPRVAPRMADAMATTEG